MMKSQLPPLPHGDDWIDAVLLAFRLTIGLRTVWRFTAAGKLPQPIRFSRKIVRWRWKAVVEHLEKSQRRQEAKDAAAVAVEVQGSFAGYATALTQ